MIGLVFLTIDNFKLKDTKGMSLGVEVTGMMEPEKQVYNQADVATS
jgi:hypothetical protein